MINPTLAVLIDFKCDIKTRECGKERRRRRAREGNK